METQNSVVKSAFFKHNHEGERGIRNVTRASAVYYFARREGFRTQLVYMNYWREKRGLDTVTRTLTLRSLAGDIVFQSAELVRGQGGHIVEINDLLDATPGAPDCGSVEVEFSSDDNLVIAYPAVIVRYIGDNWHTVAHASQRYYSQTSGDDVDMIGHVQIAEEGNITILEDDATEPFVIVHNGPVAIDARPIDVIVRSASGREMSGASAPMAWAPFQTRLIKLSDLVDFRPFLAGERGTFSMKFLIGGVFPRLIGGNDRNGAWSIDHTNFAATTGPASQDVIPVDGRPTFKELVFNLPNNFAEEWQCFADIYPTYPSEGYRVEVRNLASDGAAQPLETVTVGREGGDSFPRIRVDNALLAEGGNVELTYRHDRELPRRFHTGIHYQIGDGLPGFLTDGPLPHSTPPIRTRWFPVFEPTESRNFLMIANRTIGQEDAEDVLYKVRVFNSYGDDPLHGTLELKKGESKCLSLEDILPGATDYMRDRPGWVYMSAAQPQRSVLHYASVRGSDSIAVCHAF